MELLVVMLIVGLFASLFSVRVRNVLSGGDLRLATRIIIGELTKMRGEAAYTHRNQALEFLVDEEVLQVVVSSEKGEDKSPSGPTEAKRSEPPRVRLPKGVDLEDVVLFPGGKIQSGKAVLRFYADGSVDRALIHLRNQKDQAYTLEVNPLTGEVTLYDTYIDQSAVS